VLALSEVKCRVVNRTILMDDPNHHGVTYNCNLTKNKKPEAAGKVEISWIQQPRIDSPPDVCFIEGIAATPQLKGFGTQALTSEFFNMYAKGCRKIEGKPEPQAIPFWKMMPFPVTKSQEGRLWSIELPRHAHE